MGGSHYARELAVLSFLSLAGYGHWSPKKCTVMFVVIASSGSHPGNRPNIIRWAKMNSYQIFLPACQNLTVHFRSTVPCALQNIMKTNIQINVSFTWVSSVLLSVSLNPSCIDVRLSVDFDFDRRSYYHRHRHVRRLHLPFQLR